MDLAKTLKSDEMIALTQIFVQQPRNTVRHLFRVVAKDAPYT